MDMMTSLILTKSSTLKCFNCGKEGHGYPDCDQPLDQDRIKANREKFRASKVSGNISTRGTQRRSTGSTREQGSNSSTSGPSSDTDISLIPPKAGKPHVRILGSGKVLYWCQLCAKWNESHETRFHTDDNALLSRGTTDSTDDQSQSGATIATQPEDVQTITDIGGAVRSSFGPPHFL